METRKKRWVLGTQAAGIAVLAVMSGVIGSWGMAYLGIALEICLLLETFGFLYLPDYVEKMIRSRIQKAQYKNADKVLKAALLYALGAGIVGSLLLFFAADALCGGLMEEKEAALVLKILAPSFLLNAVSIVLQGYFQGNGTAMPTVASGVLYQIFNLSFGVLFGNILKGYGEKASALLHNEKFTYMYAAAGVAVGLLLASVLRLFFLLLIYLGAGRRMRRSTREGMRLSEDGIELFAQLMRMTLPTAVCYTLLRVGLFIGLFLFPFGTQEGMVRIADFGTFYAGALLPFGIICTLALLLAVGAQGAVVRAYRAEESKNMRGWVTGGMQAIVMFTAFFAAVLFVLPAVLTEGTEAAAVVKLARHGMLFPMLLALGIYFANILWEMERRRTVLISFALFFAGFVCAALLFNGVAKGILLLFVYGFNIGALLFCTAGGFAVFRITRCDPEWIRQFLMPVVMSALTGLCMFLLSKALHSVLGGIGTAIVSVLLCGVCHMVFLFVFQCIREKDLYVLPGGEVLRKVGKLLHLI